jgi:CRP-like cAMP-binding protein
MARVRRFKRGDTLLRQDEESGVVLVLEGHAIVRADSVEGARFAVFLLGPGGSAGLRAAHGHAPSVVEVVGLTDGSWVEWPGALLRRLAEEDAGTALGLYDCVVDLLVRVYARLLQIVFYPAPARVAQALLAYEDLLHGPEPTLTRSELASVMAVTREMLGQVIRQFESEGILRRRDGGIEILDRAGLLRHASEDIDPRSFSVVCSET